MFVQIRKWTITEGNSDKIIERFRKKPDKGPSLIEQREGFIGRELLVKNVRRGEEEVVMIIRWESEEAWKAWEKMWNVKVYSIHQNVFQKCMQKCSVV